MTCANGPSSPFPRFARDEQVTEAHVTQWLTLYHTQQAPPQEWLLLLRHLPRIYWEQVARSGPLPDKVIMVLVEDSRPAVIKAVFTHQDPPLEAIRHILLHGPHSLRTWIVQYPKIDDDTLFEAAQDFNGPLRRMIAQHPQVSDRTLQFLARSPMKRVQEEATRRLAKKGQLTIIHPYERRRRRRQQDLADPMGESFRPIEHDHAAHWPDSVYRATAAAAAGSRIRYHTLPTNERQRLCTHPDLQKHPAWIAQIKADPKVEIRLALAQNHALPFGILHDLVKDPAGPVRTALAQHPALTKQIAKRLAQDIDPQVRAAVAQNPNTPARIRAELSHDRAAQVRRAATTRPPATPPRDPSDSSIIVNTQAG